eukprot:gnl/TRDRNA2_/TRDRNA2_33888_c0_seq1.p1 gnl/TRDRNA2_/TRDRNA2_33888_c0~~gnl/TRDRNA2_/TRDRNA2_33888_c0_seq1.p1  ORF type:complete len:317 (+),score=57.89 gnl/TRDRNA2_/TRDRNA2_33888_c0_seq1:2-952(+)
MNGIDRLLLAAATGNLEDVEACLQYFPHLGGVNVCDPLSGRTALSHAAERGAGSMVEALLARRADPCAKDFFGSAPIHQAAFRGHVHVVAQLLDAGADPRAIDRAGDAALAVSVAGFLVGLEEESADPPMLAGRREGQHVACCALLLEHRANPLQHVGPGESSAESQPLGLNALGLLGRFPPQKCTGASRRAELRGLEELLRAWSAPRISEISEEIIVEAIREMVVEVLPEVCIQLSRANMAPAAGAKWLATAPYYQGPVPVMVPQLAEQPYHSYEKRRLMLHKVGDFEEAGVPMVAPLWQELEQSMSSRPPARPG